MTTRAVATTDAVSGESSEWGRSWPWQRILYGLAAGLVMGSVCLYLVAMAKPWFPDQSSLWCRGIYARKEAAVRRAHRPILLLVGGSGVHFGISAEQLTHDLGISTVNFGTQAALGVDYLLGRARPMLKPGDTVLLVFEYSMFQYEADKETDVLLDYLFSSDQATWRRRPLGTKLREMMTLSDDLVARGLIVRLVPRIREITPYKAETVNAFGDETANKDSLNNPQKLRNAQGESLEHFYVSRDSDRVVSDFILWCRSQNVRVLATFPNLMKGAVPLQILRECGAGATQFYDRMGVPHIGTAESPTYDMRYYLDTTLHMTQSGVKLRTTDLSAALRPFFVH